MKYLLTGTTVAVLLISGCQQQTESPAQPQASQPAAAAAKPASPTSGIDMAGFNTASSARDDFYEYVNGTWMKETEIPADKSNYGAFTKLADEAEENLKALIKEVSQDQQAATGSAAQKIRDFYNAYMDAESATELGAEAIREDLDSIQAIASYDDLYRAFSELGVYGVNSPIGGGIFSDLKDPDTNVVYLNQAGLTLPDRDYYLKDDENFVKGRDLYRTFVSDIFACVGDPDGAAKAEQLLALETEIAKVQWTKEDNRDPVKGYNPMTQTELADLAPKINWNVVFEAAEIPAREQYIVSQPSFFAATDDIIVNTPLNTWKDYLTFHTLANFAPVLGDEFFGVWFTFARNGLQGVEEPRPRWKRAISAVNGNMGEILGQLYVQKHFKPEAKERMVQLVDNLKEAYRQSINELDWMSDETKQQALDKLSRFYTKIGYPDNWRDYSNLEVAGGDLIGNIKQAAHFEYRRQVNKLDKPVDKTEWFMTPQTVNAYYNPVWNEIVFPASILQPPFFDLAADDAVNYGGIGAVIGHEIGHGFDDQGRKFDGGGNLRDWWTEDDNSKFEVRKEMLAKQYNAYEVIDGLTINGEFTSGENIGDLGGISIAYKAYKLSLDGKEAPVIDGLTGDQRFFMGWAQIWRTKARDEETKRRLTIDPHSPPKFRANGSVTNVPAFYAAFDVKEGDGMYLPPEDRVKIW